VRSAWLPAPCVTSRPRIPAAATSVTTPRPCRASRMPPTSSPSTAAWLSPTSGTASAATTTRRSSATAATRSPRPATTQATGPTPTAEARRPRRCLGCHTEEQLCNQCHTVDHPADWGTSHAPVAAKGTRSCLVCHPQMCVDTTIGGRERGDQRAVLRRAILVALARPAFCWPRRPGLHRHVHHPHRQDRPRLECHAKPDQDREVSRVEKGLTVPRTRGTARSPRGWTAPCHAGFEARDHTAEETQGWYEQAKLGLQRLPRLRFRSRPVVPRQPRHGEGSVPRLRRCHGSHSIVDPPHGVRGPSPTSAGAATAEETYLGNATASRCCSAPARAVCIIAQVPQDPASRTQAPCRPRTWSRPAASATRTPAPGSQLPGPRRPQHPSSSLWVWLMEMNHAVLIGV
jgi:hypothetical protein